ncbi:hypothetical protein RB598_000673 [Gaeumannomyces tritici]
MAYHDPASQAPACKIEPRSSPEPSQTISRPEGGSPGRPNRAHPSKQPATSARQKPPKPPPRRRPRLAVNKRKETAKQAKLQELLLARVANMKFSPEPSPSKTGSESIATHMGGSQAVQKPEPASDTAARPQLPRRLPVNGTVSSSLIPDQRHPIMSVADPNYGRLSPPRFDVAQGFHVSRQNLANAPANGIALSQSHDMTKVNHGLPAVPRPTQTHYLPPVPRARVGVIGPGAQRGVSVGSPTPHTGIQPIAAVEPIDSDREAPVKAENSGMANSEEPSDQAERPEEPELHSIPTMLSRECQMRRFNPKFTERKNARGFWCDLHLPGGKMVSNDEASLSSAAAKIECARKAIPVVRELPMWYMDSLPRAFRGGKSPRNKTVSAREIPTMSNALVLRNGTNGNQMVVADTPSRGYGDPSWPVRLDARESKIRKMEETMGFLIPPVYRESEVAAQAFLAGFTVARQDAESGPSPAGSGRRSRSRRERSPIRAALDSPEASRPQTRAAGRSDRRARSKSPSLDVGSSSAKTPTPSRRGRGDYYCPLGPRRPSDNYPAGNGTTDHYRP